MWPPDVVEIRVRLGLMPGEDHGRWCIEVLDPGTGELLAMRSTWGYRLSEHGHWPTAVERAVEAMLPGVLDPDPF